MADPQDTKDSLKRIAGALDDGAYRTAAELSDSRTLEMLATLRGAGPLQTADPEGMKMYFTGEIKKNLAAYNHANPDAPVAGETLSDKDLKSVSAWIVKQNPFSGHPSNWDSIQALNIEKTLMDSYGEKHHVAHGKSGEKALLQEENTIVPRVFQAMADQWQLRESGLPDLPKEMLKTLKHVDPIDMPSAPPGNARAVEKEKNSPVSSK